MLLTLSSLLTLLLGCLHSSSDPLVSSTHLEAGFYLQPDVGRLGRLEGSRGSLSFLGGLLEVEVGCVRQVGSLRLGRGSTLWGEAAAGRRVDVVVRRGVARVPPAMDVAGSSVGAASAHGSAL